MDQVHEPPLSSDYPGEGAPPGYSYPYAPACPAPAYGPFHFDLLLINQRVFSLAERYDVLDAQGVPQFTVHRLLRAGGRVLAGLVRMVVVFLGFYLSFRLVLKGHLIPALIVVWATGPAGGLVYLLIAPFRHIFIYLTGWGEQYPILTISQDTKISLWKRFTVFDDVGQPVAHFVKARWTDFYRRRWRVYAPDRQLICEVREDSWVLALARRILGTFFGLLRTDFYLFDPQGIRVGSYRRRWTILDRYVLDLGMDPWRRLDRRVALAAGILLDTGERR